MRKGQLVEMTSEAIDNYGEEYLGVTLRITHVAWAYMPASEYFAKGQPEGFHPGYDGDTGETLCDLEQTSNGDGLSFSLYSWELQLV